jgi:hypothetical protein
MISMMAIAVHVTTTARNDFARDEIMSDPSTSATHLRCSHQSEQVLREGMRLGMQDPLARTGKDHILSPGELVAWIAYRQALVHGCHEFEP